MWDPAFVRQFTHCSTKTIDPTGCGRNVRLMNCINLYKLSYSLIENFASQEVPSRAPRGYQHPQLRTAALTKILVSRKPNREIALIAVIVKSQQ